MNDDLAPICFGAVSFYSVDAVKCKACGSYENCGHKVTENIAEMSRVLDIQGLMERHRQAKARAKQAPKTDRDTGKLKVLAPAVSKNTKTAKVVVTPAAVTVSLADEAKSVYKLLLTVGDLPYIKGELQQGRNPFPRSMLESWLVGELLLRGGATRERIAGVVAHAKGGPHRAKAIEAVLTKTAIATIEDDKLVIPQEGTNE